MRDSRAWPDNPCHDTAALFRYRGDRLAMTGSDGMKTYRGSCHCGDIVFEIDTELDGVALCNCSICLRRNAVMHRVSADRFRLLQGEESLVLYQFNTGTAKHYFCRRCGIYPFHRPRVAPEAYTVNVFCLEGVDRETVAALPVTRFDGKSFSTAS